MCACKNKKNLANNKSVEISQPKTMNVSGQQKSIKKTREQLIFELRQRIKASTR